MMNNSERSLLIVDLDRGLLDGWYFSEEIASKAASHWRILGHRVVVVSLVDGLASGNAISDRCFLASVAAKDKVLVRKAME